MNKQFRAIHRKAAPLLFIPLLITAITGIGYRLGRSWFGASDGFASLMMTFHEGRYLGRPLVPVYVLLVGLGLLGMLTTGMVMALSARERKAKSVKRDNRWVHRVLSTLAAIPLLATLLTGMGYRLGRAWFNLSDKQADILMTIHQGSWLGSALNPFYVLLVGLSLIILLVTGWQMTGIFFRRRKAPKGPDA